MNRSTPGSGAPTPVNPPQPNPLHLTFKNHSFPANFITAENVLEYFSFPSNPFYDMKSCNQHIRMQNIDRPLQECLKDMPGIQFMLHSARPPLYVICKLMRTIIGISNTIAPLAYYYVINGTVYQCPDMYSLVQSRLLATVHPMRQAFDNFTRMSRFTVAKGYTWEFERTPACFSSSANEDGRGREERENEEMKENEDMEESSEEDEDSSEEEDEEILGKADSTKKKESDKNDGHFAFARSSTFQNTRTTHLMQILFNQFPPPATKLEIESATEGTPSHQGTDTRQGTHPTGGQTDGEGDKRGK